MVHRWICLSVLFLAGSCLWADSAPQTRPTACPGIVFAINGSGDSLALSDNLKDILQQQRLPFVVDTIHWTRGQGQVTDHNDVRGHEKFGRLLAGKINSYRKSCPQGKVIVVSHSSGTHVALMGAAMVPDNSIDRIILLAPCVGANYDLRRPLQAARLGIDSYYSSLDTYLTLAVDLLGTGDRQQEVAAAGVEGFRVPCRAADARLYCRLRQHAWVPELAKVGHFGGHYGWVGKPYLERYIVPLFTLEPPPDDRKPR